MKFMKILAAVMICAAMVLSAFGCTSGEGGENGDSTTTTTTKKTTTTTSDRTKVESDYEIKEIDNLVVPVGTSEADVIAMLPTELEVLMSGSSTAASQVLFSDTFDSADTFAQNWTTVGNDNGDVMSIQGGNMVVGKACNYFRTYVNDQDWMNMESISSSVWHISFRRSVSKFRLLNLKQRQVLLILRKANSWILTVWLWASLVLLISHWEVCLIISKISIFS